MSPAVLLLWLLVAASAAYYVIALLAALLFRPLRRNSFTPPVSVLKPVRGRDPGFYNSIRSHAAQNYPEFELLFAVRDPADPAIEEIRRLAAEFPEKRIEVFITDREFGPNDKVNGLARLRAECRHEALVIDDSDIRVGPDYLRRVVAPLADPSVGLVTCLYRGVPGGGLPSLLKALWLSTDFQVGVMVGRLLGVPFALGATVVVRREQLDRADGFPALAPYLADDYRLGQAINELGARIVLSDYVVETVLTGESWRASWRHRIRWNKTVRACRPGGYFGLLLTFMVPLSLAALAVAPTWWPLAAAGLGLRLAAALAVGAGRLKDPLVPRYIFLLPAADFLSFALWLAGFFGRQVVWRGSRFQLEPSGRLKRIT